uniref:Uncharacterized protein n=1 Tax=Ananas comosus var. bracteatus TaxID=296719 RepID=A0A6V7QGD8_ANACO|nr:unnamed protein product [Ananas comosus var. bracteatus]
MERRGGEERRDEESHPRPRAHGGGGGGGGWPTVDGRWGSRRRSRRSTRAASSCGGSHSSPSFGPSIASTFGPFSAPHPPPPLLLRPHSPLCRAIGNRLCDLRGASLFGR